MRFHGASGRFCTLLTPMSRNTGTPSDSMNRSYGVLGRPNFPKPARLPAEGSCQWLPGTSCMGLLLNFGWCCSTSICRHCERSEAISGRGMLGGDCLGALSRASQRRRLFLRQLALVALLVELRIHAVLRAVADQRLGIFLGDERVLHPIRDGAAALRDVHAGVVGMGLAGRAGLAAGRMRPEPGRQPQRILRHAE